MTTHEDEIFNSSALPARDQVSEWVNIKKNVGDKVGGTFLGYWENKANSVGFKDQLSVAIKQGDGKVVGISLGDTPYMRLRLQHSMIGDRIGIKYEGDKDTGKPQKAKIVKIYNPDLEKRKVEGKEVITSPEGDTKTFDEQVDELNGEE